MNKSHSISRIGKRWNRLRGRLLDNWEIVHFLNHYLEELKPLIKNKEISPFSLMDIDGKPNKPYKKYKADLYLGVISRIQSKTLLSRTLLESVALTEDFFQDVLVVVYKDYPQKLMSVKNSENENSKKYQKLLKLIIDSPDKDDIIDKLIEEKIRGIFYGNPSDFFLKDKGKLNFKSTFNDSYDNSIILYKEIIARRNIFAHNSGKVDNKYLREVDNPQFTINKKAIIDIDYITQTIRILTGLSAVVTKLVIEGIYKENNTNFICKKVISDLKKDFE